MFADLASRASAQVLKMLPRKHMSRSLGKIADQRVPSPMLQLVINAYVRAYGVDLREAVVPARGFASFDEFFTRALHPASRPIDQRDGVLVSPCDGVVEACGYVTRSSYLTVKGQEYHVADLLGSPEEAMPFEGGRFALVYLSPRDYHRVHAPVSGQVTHVRHVPGTLFPVNEIGTKNIPKVFARNERVVVHQQSAQHGQVVTVLVGAVGVGRISLPFDSSVVTNQGGRSRQGIKEYGDHGPYLRKGDELGVFHLGSTVLVFTTPHAGLTWGCSDGAAIKMGQPLAVPTTHA
jgi:phosphatidylserine decarboxylase